MWQPKTKASKLWVRGQPPKVAAVDKRSSLKNRSICVHYSLQSVTKYHCWCNRSWADFRANWDHTERERGGADGRGGVSQRARVAKEFTEKRDRERQRVSAARGEYTLMLNEFGHSAAQWNLYPWGMRRGTWQSPGVSRRGWKIEIPLSPVGSPSCQLPWLLSWLPASPPPLQSSIPPPPVPLLLTASLGPTLLQLPPRSL